MNFFDKNYIWIKSSVNLKGPPKWNPQTAFRAPHTTVQIAAWSPSQTSLIGKIGLVTIIITNGQSCIRWNRGRRFVVFLIPKLRYYMNLQKRVITLYLIFPSQLFIEQQNVIFERVLSPIDNHCLKTYFWSSINNISIILF